MCSWIQVISQSVLKLSLCLTAKSDMVVCIVDDFIYVLPMWHNQNEERSFLLLEHVNEFMLFFIKPCN